MSVSSRSIRSQRVRPRSRRNGTSWLATISAPWVGPQRPGRAGARWPDRGCWSVRPAAGAAAAGSREQQGGQRGPEQLAAGQGARPLVGPPSPEQEPRQLGPDLVVGRGRRGPGHVLDHGQLTVQNVQPLRQDTGPGPRPSPRRRPAGSRRRSCAAAWSCPPRSGRSARSAPARGRSGRRGRRSGSPGRSSVSTAAPGGHGRLRQVDADLGVVAHGLLGGGQALGLASSSARPRCVARSLPAVTWACRLRSPATIVGRPPALLHLPPVPGPAVELGLGLGQLALLPPHVGLGRAHHALGGLLLHGDRLLVVGEVAAVPAHLARPAARRSGRPAPAAPGRG